MSDKKYKWYKVAESKEELFSSGNAMVEIMVNQKPICVGHYKEKLFGCAHKCPHAGGRMAAGWLDAMGHIVCPLHRYRFDSCNGRNVSGEGYYLKTYPVEIREEGVYVGLEEQKGWL
ncbi:MAG: Rieske (2Fe-2S) protein [Bacteroidota bacterium]|jgi:nitrite reductase/ring-hydroxylating ferredoxin subunit